jgi:hypothetical protein
MSNPLLFSIGFLAAFLGIKGVYYSRKKDSEKLKKIVGTKNPKTAFILGIIGIIIGAVILILFVFGC